MAFRDTLPLYDINSEFYKQILAFDALYAATLPPPPKLVRQNAEEPRYFQLVAMEEGRPIAPYAPIKKAETSPAVTSESTKPKKVRFIEPRRLEYESDDDPDDDMYV
jgi:dipeptidyl aminopeptidase/acylaminoacyl peptidase